MLILNYKEHYERLIDFGFEKFSNVRDLSIISRFLGEIGTDKKSQKDILLNFCRENDKNFNEAREKRKVDKAILIATKPLKPLSDKIKFSEKELEAICDKANSVDDERILFTLMAICKTYSTDSLYVNSESPIKIKDILEVARTRISVDKAFYVLHSLRERGYISVMPNLKVTLLCLDKSKDSEVALEIKPNLFCLNALEVYRRRGIYCQKCGAFARKKSNNTKYCPKCRRIIKNQRKKPQVEI